MQATIRHLLDRFPPQEAYLIGVSGGRDSVVLLHALRQGGYEKLRVVHLNHGLRGAESGADARFIRRLAAKWSVECEVAKVAVDKWATRHKQSIETAGRAARLAFFAEVAQRVGCERVFLAHHADDQVETVLMNFFRGTGAGLAGMREETRMAVHGQELRLIRPLLRLWRSEVEAYAQQHGLPFREDSSNEKADFLRNRVRHQLLPSLTELFGRDVRQAVARLAEQQQAENDFLEACVAKEEVTVKTLRAMPLALRRRAMKRWLGEQQVPNISFELIERALALVEPKATAAKINLPSGLFLRRRAGHLFIEGP